MTEHDSYLSTLLCGIELIHSGVRLFLFQFHFHFQFEFTFFFFFRPSLQVTCFAEAGGQHVSGMARAVNLLGLRACLAQSTMDSGHGLPTSWAIRTTHDCLQVNERIKQNKFTSQIIISF